MKIVTKETLTKVPAEEPFKPGEVYNSKKIPENYYLCARVVGSNEMQLINVDAGTLVPSPWRTSFTHVPNAGLYIPGIS